jgi:hypothetical protein
MSKSKLMFSQRYLTFLAKYLLYNDYSKDINISVLKTSKHQRIIISFEKS